MKNIIKLIKSNNFIKSLYHNLIKVYKSTLFSISPILLIKYDYKKAFGVELNCKNPRNFNEKILWLLFNWRNPLIVKCSDKYRVREYLKDNNCEETLNDLIGVYKNTCEIDFDKLPQQFALKCNHGCGYNIICDNKSKLNINETIIKLDQWLKEKYGKQYGEIHYDKIEPLIVCEKYISALSGPLPLDYKIYCFNGEPKCILVCSNRHINKKLNYYDLNWNPLQYTTNLYKGDDNFKAPVSLNKMIEVSKKLSSPFPFVRIDFYDADGQPIFGEMTFTPAGGMIRSIPEEILLSLGEQLHLPKEKMFNGW